MAKQIDQVILLNYKKHKEYKGEFAGNHFIVSGVNGAGKTSVFEAIKRMLGMSDEKPPKPVKTGEEDGRTGMYLSDNGVQYYVEEKFAKGNGNGRLRFYRVNGAGKDELTPAVARLQEIVGTPIDFSPLMDKDGKEQFVWLTKNLGIDITRYELDYSNRFADRTLINREITRLKAHLESPENSVVKNDKETYTEEKRADDIIAKKINVGPLFDVLNKANAFNEKRKNAVEEVDSIKAQILALQKRLATGEEWLAANPVIDTNELQGSIEMAKNTNALLDEEIKTVSDHNLMVAKVKRFVDCENELQEKKRQSDALTKKLAGIQTEIFKAFADLNIGEIVPGLELRYILDDNGKVKEQGLFMDGLPFHRSQQSYGQMLKALVKLSSFFNAGKLNFVSIGDWNLLDSEGQAEVWKFVKDNPDLNVQLGVERVDDAKEIITEIVER